MNRNKVENWSNTDYIWYNALENDSSEFQSIVVFPQLRAAAIYKRKDSKGYSHFYPRNLYIDRCPNKPNSIIAFDWQDVMQQVTRSDRRHI